MLQSNYLLVNGQRHIRSAHEVDNLFFCDDESTADDKDRYIKNSFLAVEIWYLSKQNENDSS